MFENKDHTFDFMSLLYVPLYREFTRILIWPVVNEGEESTYQVWSPHTEIPPDFKSSEIVRYGVPFFNNHHYIAVPADAGQFNPHWVHYREQPDCSIFQSAVKVYTFKVYHIDRI